MCTCLMTVSALQATVEFRGNMRKLVVAFAAVIGTHFLAGFIILIIVYGLMIRTIRRMRERNATRKYYREHNA